MNENTKALIYCRVSSQKQATQGHGLDSQELRCRQYAQNHGYEVEAVFPDDVSGGGDFMKRPGLVALLSYLDAQPHKGYVVIFDDLKRFARDTEFHIALRRAFQRRKARIECLNFKFDDTPEGKFIETIMAAQGELERQQNSRQVIQKMQARVAAGYWCFKPIIGYKYKRVDGHGKLLVPEEPVASIVKEALEGYASGRFETMVEVQRFLERQPMYPKDPHGEVHYQRAAEMLAQPFYSGYITVKKWGVELQPGKQQPLISLATGHAIQRRDKAMAKAPVRVNISDEFPLRGFVTCADCGQQLTACWSKGRSARYPYYLCDTRGCPSYRKSIRREKIEGEFEELLKTLKPSQGLFHLAFEMFRDLWNEKLSSVERRSAAMRQDLALITKKVDQLLGRLVDATSESVVAAYERKIRDYETEKAVLADNLGRVGKPMKSFGDTYRTAFDFLANPLKLWHSQELADRRAVLRLVFSEKLPYQRGHGYRTAQVTAPFRFLGVSDESEGLVEPIGIEPTTF